MISKVKESDVEEVLELLNKYISFGLSTKESVLYKIANQYMYKKVINDKIVGLISYKKIEEDDINTDKITSKINIDSNYIVNYLLVIEEYRGIGISYELFSHIENELYNLSKTHIIYRLGWVKSSTNKWDSEKLAIRFGYTKLEYISNYFESEEKLPCPYCKEYCKCDAVIYFKQY